MVLEAELVEINKDITYCEQCVQKYGCAPPHPARVCRQTSHAEPRPLRRPGAVASSFVSPPASEVSTADARTCACSQLLVMMCREYFTYPLQHLKVSSACSIARLPGLICLCLCVCVFVSLSSPLLSSPLLSSPLLCLAFARCLPDI